MIIPFGFMRKRGSAFSSDAQPVIDRYSSLSSTEETSIATFVDSEVSDGNWGLYDEFFCFSLNVTDSLIGFLNFTATLVSTPTHSLQGYAISSGKYIDSQFNPTVYLGNYTRNDANYGCFVTAYSSTGGNKTLLGIDTLAYMRQNASNARVQEKINRTTQLNRPVHGASFAGVNLWSNSRTANNAHDMYKNGVGAGVANQLSQGLPNDTAKIGANTTGAEGITGTISSAFFGAGVGFDQVAHNTNHRQLLIDLGVTL